MGNRISEPTVRTAVYGRYSTALQRDASIEDQVRECEAYAARLGWTVVEVYADHGMSGASMLRPSYQRLLQDASTERFEVVLAEALDRLSRDQEHVASLFKHLVFAGVKLVTLAEGEISELHVGLKGTMNALYLKDLAQKTRRGLEGRVRQGRSGGGLCYGYEVVREIDSAGNPIRGERRIREEEAEIVRRIFRAFADGISPTAIAKALNVEGVPGPRGRSWGPSTIYGNWRRGTGVLNNELYIGRLVWNRQRFIRDPRTGRRVARPNAEPDWIAHEVPELRIVPQELWDAVKRRQGQVRKAVMAETDRGIRSERARRPIYLLSGLLRCGECRGTYSMMNVSRYGCTNAKTRGTCTNRLTIRRDHLEEVVLLGLKSRLMHPDLVKEFVAEYHREINAQLSSREAGRKSLERDLARTKQEIGRIIEAIKAGVRAASVQEELEVLEARKAELEHELRTDPPAPVRLHPNLSEVYRAKVEHLREALNADDTRTEAAEVLRSLIQEIRLVPKDGKLLIHLIGHLAGMLELALKDKPGLDEAGLQVTLVAGARNHLYFLFTAMGIPRVV